MASDLVRASQLVPLERRALQRAIDLRARALRVGEVSIGRSLIVERGD